MKKIAQKTLSAFLFYGLSLCCTSHNVDAMQIEEQAEAHTPQQQAIVAPTREQMAEQMVQAFTVRKNAEIPNALFELRVAYAAEFGKYDQDTYLKKHSDGLYQLYTHRNGNDSGTLDLLLPLRDSRFVSTEEDNDGTKWMQLYSLITQSLESRESYCFRLLCSDLMSAPWQIDYITFAACALSGEVSEVEHAYTQVVINRTLTLGEERQLLQQAQNGELAPLFGSRLNDSLYELCRLFVNSPNVYDTLCNSMQVNRSQAEKFDLVYPNYKWEYTDKYLPEHTEANNQVVQRFSVSNSSDDRILFVGFDQSCPVEGSDIKHDTPGYTNSVFASNMDIKSENGCNRLYCNIADVQQMFCRAPHFNYVLIGLGVGEYLNAADFMSIWNSLEAGGMMIMGNYTSRCGALGNILSQNRPIVEGVDENPIFEMIREKANFDRRFFDQNDSDYVNLIAYQKPV